MNMRYRSAALLAAGTLAGAFGLGLASATGATAATACGSTLDSWESGTGLLSVYSGSGTNLGLITVGLVAGDASVVSTIVPEADATEQPVDQLADDSGGLVWGSDADHEESLSSPVCNANGVVTSAVFGYTDDFHSLLTASVRLDA